MRRDYKSWARQRSFRRPNQSYAFKGLQAHVTACLANQNDLLDEKERLTYLDIVKDAAKDERWELLALCVMPDHVHLLIKSLSEAVTLPQIIAYIKRQYSLKTGRKGRWQTSYHDRLLRDNESAINRARYIVNNPVRAGLCGDFKTWKTSYWADGTIF